MVGDGRPEGALEALATDRGRAAVALGAQIGAAPGAPCAGVGLDGARGEANEAVELRLGAGAAAAHAAANRGPTRYWASRPAGATWSVPASASAWWAGSPQ